LGINNFLPLISLQGIENVDVWENEISHQLVSALIILGFFDIIKKKTLKF